MGLARLATPAPRCPPRMFLDAARWSGPLAAAPVRAAIGDAFDGSVSFRWHDEGEALLPQSKLQGAPLAICVPGPRSPLCAGVEMAIPVQRRGPEGPASARAVRGRHRLPVQRE